jgi:hypothetical protein
VLDRLVVILRTGWLCKGKKHRSHDETGRENRFHR